MEREALKLALEALLNSVDLVVEDAYNAEQLYGSYPTRQARIGGLKGLADKHREAITAAEEALAQPEQEPWRESASDYERGFIDGRQKQAQSSVDKAVNRMAQRPWVYLTDEHIKEIVGPYALPIIGYTRKLFNQIEAKSKELNT